LSHNFRELCRFYFNPASPTRNKLLEVSRILRSLSNMAVQYDYAYILSIYFILVIVVIPYVFAI